MKRDYDYQRKDEEKPKISVESSEVKKYGKEPEVLRREIEELRQRAEFYRSSMTSTERDHLNQLLEILRTTPQCPICEGRGHTMFQCGTYFKLKEMKKSVSGVKKPYDLLVAEEMIRIHEETLSRSNFRFGN